MTDRQYNERSSFEARVKAGESLSLEERALLTAYRIHRDGSDRSGWDAMMNDIDDETAEEIITTWAEIICSTMEQL